MKRILSLATATGLIFLAGCGGSGSSSNGSPNPSVTLTSSVAQVSYGQPVTISWHSSNADTVQSNFGAGSSQINGSLDRKSTRLNSSHVEISYAVFCLK